jgi:hypothetical protein
LPRLTRYLLIAITSAFVALILLKSIGLTKRNGGTDLRCRVVGTRLLATEHSPYFHKWQPADGQYLLDPNDKGTRMVNGNVVTPATMYLTYPLYTLPYSIVRPAWTVLQCLACIATLFLLLWKQPRPAFDITALVIINGLVCSATWLAGIERGQMYIFYALLFALMYRLYVSKLKYNEWLSGFVGGLFIFVRPFAGIIGLGFLLHGKKKWVLGCVMGFLAGVCLFVLPRPSLWSDYFKAMREYSYESEGRGHYNQNTVEYSHPDTIEGMTTLKNYENVMAVGLAAFYGYLWNAGINATSNHLAIAYGIVLALLAFLFYRHRKIYSGPLPLFLFGFLCYVLAELFTVAPRASYNGIQWIFPLTLICLYAGFITPVLITLITGLLLLHVFPVQFYYQGALAELTFLALTFIVIFYQRLLKKTQYGIGGTGQQ